jgi:hypothetical protein
VNFTPLTLTSNSSSASTTGDTSAYAGYHLQVTAPAKDVALKGRLATTNVQEATQKMVASITMHNIAHKNGRGK